MSLKKFLSSRIHYNLCYKFHITFDVNLKEKIDVKGRSFLIKTRPELKWE